MAHPSSLLLFPQMSEAFAKAGPPLKNIGVVEIGIKSAIAALGEPSEAQSEYMERYKYASKVTQFRSAIFYLKPLKQICLLLTSLGG